MKKHFITYLLFGLLGGLSFFLMSLYRLHHSLIGIWYLAAFVLFVLGGMLFNRFRNKEQNSFSRLFGIGITIAIISLVSFTIFSQVLPNLIYDQDQKVKLVDDKVNRLIMDFEGSKIDIFDMEEQALVFFERSIGESLLILVLFLPLAFLVTTFLALVFKKTPP